MTAMRFLAGFALLTTLGLAGCGKPAETKAHADTVQAAVITVRPVVARPVQRTVDMVGTLRGWEDVTVGTKRTGRVMKVLHDMGDRVAPGEPLVALDDVDAKLAIDQARSKYLAELVKLGLTEQQAEQLVHRFGIKETILHDEEVKSIILRVPVIVQARALLEKAKLDVARQQHLYERSSGSLQQLQDYQNAQATASAQYDNAIVTAQTVIATAVSNYVALKQAEQMLKDMVVLVPEPTNLPKSSPAKVTYALAQRQAAEGQMVREGDAVAELVIEDPLRLWGNVPERYIADVQVGQNVQIRVAAYEKETFPGTVARINPAVDPVSRTFQVEVAVPNPDHRLRPGGFAKAAIVTRSDDHALVVPRDAIEKYAGVTKVFILNDPVANRPTVRSVPVSTGAEMPDAIEVRGALKAGQQVAVTNLGQLADGTWVQIREGEKGTRGQGDKGK